MNHLKIALYAISFAGLLVLPQKSNATSFILNDFVITVNDSTGTAITGGLKELQFGFFSSGFTPNAANTSQWFANFTGVSGYYDPNGPEWSAGINIDDNSLFPVGVSLVAMVFNVADDIPLTTTLLQNPSTQGAIITNTRWVITAASGEDTTQRYYDAVGSLVGTTSTPGVTTALVGTWNSGTGSVGLTLVPEPSTGALMMIGAAGLVALRRLRKV